jgi:hypothetical protein
MKIPIKKYIDDLSLSWEERYKRLENHHMEETAWMIKEIKRLEKLIIDMNNKGKDIEEEYKKKAERNKVTIDNQGRPMQGGYYMTGCPFCGNPYCGNCK